jgi:hypothetical protein
MQKVVLFLGLVCLAVLLSTVPASAEQAVPQVPDVKETVMPATVAPAPASPELKPDLLQQILNTPLSGEISKSGCPANYCQQAKLECEQGCAPCIGTATCAFRLCDAMCYCQC